MMTRLFGTAICSLTLLASCAGGGGTEGVVDPSTTDGTGGAGATPASTGPAAVTAGEITVPFPTIRNLSVEWAFTGDANANASVAARYRPKGATGWSDALPLRRVQGGSNAGFSWSTRFSGSVFDLQPDTDYDIELSLNDPDGGSTVRTTSARTRAVPQPMSGAPVRPATPATFAAVLRAAQPGDIVELEAGRYAWPDWSANGTPGRPIVIRSSAGAVVDGEIGLFSRSHIHLSGLVVNGRIRFNGSREIAITRCTVNASSAFAGDGIVAYTRAENAYIADNVVTGLTAWAAGSLGVNGANLGEGIVVTGPGHVIEHNRVRGFRDGISLMEQSEAVDQFSIDIVGNEIGEAADDGIEADFCRHNCRIVRNRLTNTFVALSSQPSLGGPTYFVRNVAYNVSHVAFKLYRGSVGDVLLHNTVVKGGDAFAMYPGTTVSNLYSRNNLFIGGPGGMFGGFSSGRGDVAVLGDVVLAGSSLDYDALGSTLGTFLGTIGTERFGSPSGMRAGTMERNGLQVDLSVFAQPVALPTAAMTTYPPADLRPAAAAVVVGAGQALPNVGAVGGGRPSIGAYEPGVPLPVYGPR